MNCLHICNDFLGSRVHENLYLALAKENVTQTIYYHVRPYTKKKVFLPERTRSITLIASKPLRKYHRVLFRNKIRYLYNDISKKTDLKGYSVLHATTLFTDGALALKIHKIYKTPYIVAVRGSDVNIFAKYRPDLFPLAKQILEKAHGIVFISKSLEINFHKLPFTKGISEYVKAKSHVINNGIDPFWIERISPQKKKTPSKMLYIGNFERNKNVLKLVSAVVKARKKHPDLQLDIVGSHGIKQNRIIELSNKLKGILNYHGPIYDKKRLLEIYRSSDLFAMASLSETFGLVYIEALSQGLPVLCSKDQGIDGTFDKTIGEFVDPKSVDSIVQGIDKLIEFYGTYEINGIEFSRFSWDAIAKNYKSIYMNL